MTDRLKQLSLVITILAAILSLLDAFTEISRTKAFPIVIDEFISALYFLLQVIGIASLTGISLIAIGLLIANRKSAYPFLNKISDRLAIFTWEDLKVMSENPFFKLSYVSLVAIPILIYLVKIGFIVYGLDAAKDAVASVHPGVAKLPEIPKFQWTVPANLKISFFSAFSFAIALILLAVFCPKDIKTGASFANPNNEITKSNAPMRIFCTMFYAVGLFLLVYVLINSATYVYYA